jgi:hypothetical protein
MSRSKGVFLTYDNLHTTDGLGAQFQRILSVYCIAELFGTSYFHSPIVDFDEQMFIRLDSEAKLAVLSDWNSLISSRVTSKLATKTNLDFTIGNLTPAKLYIIKIISRIFQISITLRLWNPRLITDKLPHCFEYGKDFLDPRISSQSRVTDKKGNHLQIVVHIRQGELRLSQFKHRYLPFSYFERILSTIVPEIRMQNLSYSVTIPVEPNINNTFSEMAPEVIDSLKTDSTNEFVTINNSGEVKIVFEKLDEMASPYLREAKWQDSGSSYTDFLAMLNADVLIISKSSFSFTAGLLNKKGIIIYCPFWHSAPPSWLIGEHLRSKDFALALETWISRNE